MGLDALLMDYICSLSFLLFDTFFLLSLQPNVKTGRKSSFKKG